MKAKTMLFHVVQSASLSRFYRKHYLPSNLLENRKSWNPSVNSATVIFGAKMAVKDENLMFASLQTLRTHCLHFQYDVSNVPSHTEHVKRSLEQAKSKKRPKSADLVVLRLSQRAKTEKCHFLPEDSIFFKTLSRAFSSTWMQTLVVPPRFLVVLVRRNFDFCVFLGLGGPEIGPAGPKSNLEVSFSPRGINIFQNPFNSIFVNLNANFPETPEVFLGLGEEKLRFLCFFFWVITRYSGAALPPYKKKTQNRT